MFDLKLFPAAVAAAFLVPGAALADEAKTYNAFIKNDFNSSGSDTEGRVAVGGNANLNGYSVGYKLPGYTGTTLGVGGTLNFNSGQVDHGNTVAGGLNLSSFGHPNGTASVGSFDITTEFARMVAKSNALFGYASNGSVTLDNPWYPGYNLVGTQTGLNVFNLTGALFSGSNYMNIVVPTGAQVLINVDGATSGSWHGGLNVNGVTADMAGANVLWNFNTAALNVSSIAVLGTVLAPNTDIFANGMHFAGTVIGKSYTGNGQINLVSYQGTLLDGPADIGESLGGVPEPSVWTVLILGFGMVGGALRRRKRTLALA